MIQSITQEDAEQAVGELLPHDMNWYQLSKLQFYPNYGDWKYLWVGDGGICAIIGKRKRPVVETVEQVKEVVS